MSKWLQILLGVCAVILTSAGAYAALRTPHASASDVRDAVYAARLQLAHVDDWQHTFERRTGRYGALHELRDSIPAVSEIQAAAAAVADLEITRSVNDKAYLAVATYPDYGIACAAYVVSKRAVTGDTPMGRLDSRVEGVDNWRGLRNGGVVCRRTGLLWSLLSWTDAAYL